MKTRGYRVCAENKDGMRTIPPDALPHRFIDSAYQEAYEYLERHPTHKAWIELIEVEPVKYDEAYFERLRKNAQLGVETIRARKAALQK